MQIRSYLRVSSDKQAREGTSLEGQQHAHARYCASQKLPPPTFYIEVESGSAAQIEARAEQLRLQAEAEPGDIVLVTMVDRWSRDVPHAVLSSRALIARNIGWIAFEEGIDARTREGQLMLQYRAIAAEQELGRIRERMVGGRIRLAEAGLYAFGHKPLGYRRDDARKLILVPEEAAVVRALFSRCAAGESLRELAERVPAPRGRPSWTLHTVKRALFSRWALGESRSSKGAPWRPGTHEAIITHEQWDAAHAALVTRRCGGRKYGNGDTAKRLLRGLLWCSRCGKRVSVRFGSSAVARGERAQYYACRSAIGGPPCGEGWLSGEALDAEVSTLAQGRLEELSGALSRPARLAEDAAPTTDHAGALARLEGKKRRAIDLATDGAMPRDVLQETLARYEQEAATLRRQIEREAGERARAAKARDPRRRVELLRYTSSLRAAWGAMNVDARREVVSILAERIEVGQAGAVCKWRTIEALSLAS